MIARTASLAAAATALALTATIAPALTSPEASRSGVALLPAAHAASVQTWYMAVTGDDGQLHKLGACRPGTHERIWQIPTGARSDLYWINAWPAGMIHSLTAQQLIDKARELGYAGNRLGYNWANGPETAAGPMIAGHAYEIDCIPAGMEQPGTTNDGTTPLVPKPSAPAKPATKRVAFRVQIDTIRVRTATQAAVINRIGASYAYREDVHWNVRTGRVYSAPLWARGVSSWTIHTGCVTVPATATPAQVLAAEAAQASRMAGVTTGRLVTARPGATVVAAYLIPAGSWDSRTTWRQGPKTAPQLLAGSAIR